MKLKRLTPLLCALAVVSVPYCRAQGNDTSDLDQLRAKLAEQQRQIETLSKALAEQQKMLEALTKSAAPRPLIASTTPMVVPAATTPAPKALPPIPQREASDASPLQLKIGDTTIIPIGFMDMTAVWRDKNAASSIGTNFASVPYINTTAGHLTEFRFSPQNSRVGFRMDTNVHGAHVIGYNEFDFLGTSGGFNLGVTNGAFVPRLRLFWVDVRKDKFEFLGGQSWSMLTPNRKGISPLPGDIFYSQVVDVNYLIGLTWTRQPGFRFVYHPTEKVTAGLALENPNQYVGGSAGAGVITFPAAFSALPGGEFDNATNVLNTPNLHPDIIAKVAFDPSSKAHFEIAGIERSFRDWNPNTNQHFTKAAGGGSVGANFEVSKGVRLIGNGHWGDGTGRYLFGTVPDLVVRADGSLSPIHDHSVGGGIEATVKNTLWYLYYGGAWSGQNPVVDANGTSLVGFGYRGSPNNQNRSMEEITFGLNETLWKDPRWGALNFMAQYMYFWRSPWSVGTNQPSGAHDNTIYVNVRYTLPGNPPSAK